MRESRMLPYMLTLLLYVGGRSRADESSERPHELAAVQHPWCTVLT